MCFERYWIDISVELCGVDTSVVARMFFVHQSLVWVGADVEELVLFIVGLLFVGCLRPSWTTPEPVS